MRREREQAQIVLDVMFEVLSRCHARDLVPSDREELMEWARGQLRVSGVDVHPTGSSHAVLREAGEDPMDDALYFLFSDFEFLHSSQDDRLARVKRFMKIVGIKLVDAR